MTWLTRALPVIAAIVLFAPPAVAQVSGHPIEASAQAGLFKYDLRARVKKGPAYMGIAGWRATPRLTFEGNALLGPSKSDTASDLKQNFSYFGVDGRWNLKVAENPAVPFLLVGAGYATSHTIGHPPDKLSRGAANLGMGFMVSVMNPRTYLRFQVRDVLFRDRDSKEFSNHLAVTAGVHYVFGGKYRDQDRDGVRDWLDQCGMTPPGCTVDTKGCPTDADGDSVCDGVDQCPNTPLGARVDKKGCPIDRDGDGVADGIDQCPDTPKGATVDAKGCTSDPDGDGVPDGLDQCANTPKGCPVDSAGCTLDTDGDGVCDALDQCANTPKGYEVGPTGCPTTIGRFERTLLDSGLVRLSGIRFGTDKAKIDSSAALDSAGVVLQQYPLLRFEIGGPTDVKGKQGEKERLSLDMARAVSDYLKLKYPLINGGQYLLRGYAVTSSTAPQVPSAAERLKGRRIELKVLNPEQLQAEREKRGLGKQ